MKRFALYLLSLVLGVTIASAQEVHYSYRYTGTTYKAEGGGETSMTNKLSSACLKSSFTASILPDHKTIWIYSSTINERCTGKGVYKNGGYQYSSPLSEVNIFEMINEQLPTGSYSLFLPANNSRIICTTLEERGKDYFVTRYDYYSRTASVAAPHNTKRIEQEREEAKLKADIEQWDREKATRDAKEKAEKEQRDRELENSIGRPFPMAHFVDSHGNRVENSHFQRGKKRFMAYVSG